MEFFIIIRYPEAKAEKTSRNGVGERLFAFCSRLREARKVHAGCRALNNFAGVSWLVLELCDIDMNRPENSFWMILFGANFIFSKIDNPSRVRKYTFYRCKVSRV